MGGIRRAFTGPVRWKRSNSTPPLQRNPNTQTQTPTNVSYPNLNDTALVPTSTANGEGWVAGIGRARGVLVGRGDMRGGPDGKTRVGEQEE